MTRLIPLLTGLAILLTVPGALAADLGDLNNDGGVDTADAELAADALGAVEGDEDFLPEADMDGDGVISLADVNAILAGGI